MAAASEIAIRKRHCDRVTLTASSSGPTGEPEPALVKVFWEITQRRCENAIDGPKARL